jgi:limonene-1,2-epoxide hydrolase
MSEFAERFMRQLKQLESTREVEPLLELFAEEAELSRAPRHAIYRGPDGARTFWAEYLDAFARIETEFEKVIEGDGAVVLEWRSRAQSLEGHAIEYTGCSVLEVRDARVGRFRTYYDAESAGAGRAPRKTAASSNNASLHSGAGG